MSRSRHTVLLWTAVTVGALLIGPIVGFVIGQSVGQNQVEVDNATLLEGRANNCRTGALAALSQLDAEGVDQLLALDPELADQAINDLSVLPDACLVEGVVIAPWVEPLLEVAATAAHLRIALPTETD